MAQIKEEKMKKCIKSQFLDTFNFGAEIFETINKSRPLTRVDP